MILPAVPYVIFLLLYIVGFSVAALLMYFAQYGIIRLCERKKYA